MVQAVGSVQTSVHDKQLEAKSQIVSELGLPLSQTLSNENSDP
jgi:hypothetical protein